LTARAGRGEGDGGFTTIQYVVASGFSLLLFVMIANLLVDLYERGAVRDALDEGARSAVPIAATTDDCEARAHAVLQSIAGGSSRRVAALTCTRDGDRVVASARVSLRSWFPALLPDWRIDLHAAAHRER
jgi:hypothetical protein